MGIAPESLFREAGRGIWRYIGTWVQPPLFTSYWRFWSDRESYRELELPENSGVLLYFDGHHILPSRELDAIQLLVERKCDSQDEALFENYRRVAKKYSDEYLHYSEGMEKGKGALKNRLEDFFGKTDLLFAPWLAVFPISWGVESRLNAELAKHGYRLADLAEHFVLPGDTMLMKQEKETREFGQAFREKGLSGLLQAGDSKILDKIAKGHPDLHGKMADHLKKYEWVGTHHCWGEPFSMEQLLKQISGALPPEKRVRSPEKLPSKIEWLIKWANEFAYWRQNSAECTVVGLYRARPMLREAAQEFGMGYNDIIWLTKNEIIDGLGGADIPDMRTISQREQIYGYIPTDSGANVLTGNVVRELAGALIPAVDKSITEFKGTIGSKGYAVGKAYIAFKPQDAIDMQEGQILVVPQTTPDYVMVMRKAGAIVTDEGGITCHAAIVSRELGIPCIVGTKVATRVLKTGDKIEVDANSGTVRKI